MVIVVIGLGSMGRRRVRLLKQISDNFSIVGVDNSEDRCKQAIQELDIKTYNDLNRVFLNEKPDCAIISTSPLSHASIIEDCINHDCHVFTELNLVDDRYQSNIKLAKDRNKVLFLSSTFLYREEIRFIRNKMASITENVNYNYHVGQYLPDWHPWESIQDYFVGDKKTNGCRELLAIEFPWIIKTFGEIESFYVLSDKISNLPINYNDNYMVLLKHQNGNKGVLCVDVISRKAIRNLEIYGEQIYLTWDGSPNGLKEYDYKTKSENNIDLYNTIDKQDGYASFIIENAYRNELEAFINSLNGTSEAEYTFEEDYKTLSMIDKIEKSMC